MSVKRKECLDMAIFRYKGVERNGLCKSGIVTANNKQECMNYLLDNPIFYSFLVSNKMSCTDIARNTFIYRNF